MKQRDEQLMKALQEKDAKLSVPYPRIVQLDFAGREGVRCPSIEAVYRGVQRAEEAKRKCTAHS